MQQSLNFLYENNSCLTIKDTMQLLGICPWHYHKHIYGLKKAPAEFKMHFLDMIFKYPFCGSIDVACKKELMGAYNSLNTEARKKLVDYDLYENLADISKILTERFKFYSVTSHNHAKKTIWLITTIYNHNIMTNIDTIGQDIIPALIGDMDTKVLAVASRKFDMVAACNTLTKYADPEHNILVIMLINHDKFSSRIIKKYIKVKFGKNASYTTLSGANKKITTTLIKRPAIFTKLHSRGYIQVSTCYLDEFIDNNSEDLLQLFYNVLPAKSRLSLYMKFADCLCRYGQMAKTKWTPVSLLQGDISVIKQNYAKAIKLFAIGLVTNRNISTRSIKNMDTYDCCPEITLNYLLGNPLESIVTQIKNAVAYGHDLKYTLSETNLSKIPDLYVVYNASDHVNFSPVLRALIKREKIYINKTIIRSELAVLVNEVGNIRSITSPVIYDKTANMTFNSADIQSRYKIMSRDPATYNTNYTVSECSLDAQEYLTKTFPLALSDNDKLIDRHIYGPRIRMIRSLIYGLRAKCKNGIYADIIIVCMK